MLLRDVTPFSLGIEINYDYTMSVVIPRNTAIPTKKTKNFTTIYDNQINVTFPVYEGESMSTKDNNLLGQFRLSNIPPEPKCVSSIDVTFNIDANGVLNVSARHMSAGQTNNIFITNERTEIQCSCYRDCKFSSR